MGVPIRYCLALLALVMVSPARQEASQPPPRAEPSGQSLPHGAIRRLGVLPYRADGPIACMAFSPDGKTIATGGYSGDIYVWDSTTGNRLRRIDTSQQWIFCLAFAPDG